MTFRSRPVYLNSYKNVHKTEEIDRAGVAYEKRTELVNGMYYAIVLSM